jgi:hypothetical protein
MTPEELQKVNEYSKEIAKILYADTDPKTLDSLDAIERVVRQKRLEHVTPQVGIFYRNSHRHQFRAHPQTKNLSR